MNSQFKDKTTLMKYMFDMRKKILNRDCLSLSSEEKTLCTVLENHVNSLPTEYREIIFNDFINEKNHDWWTEYYSKSTYYRLKFRAMDELLNNLKW